MILEFNVLLPIHSSIMILKYELKTDIGVLKITDKQTLVLKKPFLK